MKLRQCVLIGLVFGGLIFVPTPAFADGIDIGDYLLRAGFTRSPALNIAMIPLLMLANYLLNLLVIGCPAIKLGGNSAEAVARGLIWFTLLGQAADRVGAIAAIPVLMVLSAYFNSGGVAEAVLQLLFANFVLTGIAIAALSLYFLRRRWGVSTRASWLIALAAAVFTNPIVVYLLAAMLAQRLMRG